ncbi:hypothetical protein AB0F11_26660 [Streptomyces sp. NPDC032472]|uniref:hypothetical protein n=1 Tax=Streptomyces sp. NPDC032472 TaxID=3155018 RepID=UPI0033DA1E0F
MSAEQRAQGRGWVRIPASRTEQPAPARAAPYGSSYGGPYGPPAHAAPDQTTIYLSLVERWREAGRTLPGHPDEEWERLISQPCWPGR